MTTNAADALERLEQKWRAKADSYGSDDWGVAKNDALHQCADELAALQASLADRQGEAVAWQCRSAWGDGFTEWQECSKEDYEQMAPLLMDCRGEALATQFRPLYTHPAPAAVDDAMVERALDEMFRFDGNLRNAVFIAAGFSAACDAAAFAWQNVYDAEVHGDGLRSDNRRAAMRAALNSAMQIGGPP